jgi:hypothetical protein
MLGVNLWVLNYAMHTAFKIFYYEIINHKK